MNQVSFGKMRKFCLPAALSSRCEIMHFEREGRDHDHDVPEIAIAVSGSGFVIVDGVELHVEEGDATFIPANKLHRMRPDEGEILRMMIVYPMMPITAKEDVDVY